MTHITQRAARPLVSAPPGPDASPVRASGRLAVAHG